MSKEENKNKGLSKADSAAGASSVQNFVTENSTNSDSTINNNLKYTPPPQQQSNIKNLSNAIRNKFQLNEFSVAFLLILIVILKAISQFEPVPAGNYSLYYTYNYDFGFINRSFIGTITNILSKNLGISLELTMYYMCIFITFVSTCMLILLCFVIVRKLRLLCENNAGTSYTKIYYLFISIIIIAFLGPVFSFYYLAPDTLDVYMFVIAIIELILIIYKRWLFLLVPLSLLASLCYEGYFMMYFPVVFLPLIYLIVKSHDKERKKYIAIAVITFIVTFLLCFYFIYIATSNASLEQFIQHFFAVNGSDANIDNKTLTAYYLRFLTHTFNQGIFFGLEAAGFPSLLHIMSLLWLLFAILIVIFTRKIVEISRTTTDKLLFILLFIAPFLPIIAMFVTQSDWDRFLFPYVIYYIFSPIIFIIFGNETMITAYSRLADFFIRKPFFGLIISLCIIICFYDDLGWNIVRQIKNIFVYLIALISGDPTSFNPSYELVSEIPGIGDYTLPE